MASGSAAAHVAEVLAGLSRPEAYSHPVDHVTVVQTHVSIVFLAGPFAYKVKKPVHFDFLDAHLLERRAEMCAQEVTLNRRLSPELYLGVVAITRRDGALLVGGNGEPVEYAVQMRRLPADRMMDRMLEAGALTRQMAEQVADVLASFHARAGGATDVAAFGTPAAVQALWDEHFAQVTPFIGNTLSPLEDGFLRAVVAGWSVRKRRLLSERVATGRIRDGHGDLRTSSVCFTEPLTIFDCLDFSARLRCSDVASEVAFLAMDLRMRLRPDLAGAFVDRYIERSGDTGLRQLLPFYVCYRACVRGKVESLRAGEPEISPAEREEAERLARGAFGVACEAASEDLPPVLLAVAGLSGTGKSTLAAELAARRGWEVLSSDVVRKVLHGLAPVEHARAEVDRGLYSPEATRRTCERLATQAGAALDAGRCVIIDATSQSTWQRELLASTARRHGGLFLLVEVRASDAVVRARLARRANDVKAVSDADWEVYAAQKVRWEPVELGPWAHLVVDGDAPLGEVVQQVERGLNERLSPPPPPVSSPAAE
ncbi:MAG TPA: AAA family ATPase [Myxococcaceae bacterium]|nr:AAA family ATPase [Myxococcaceae bacterium]